MKCMFSMVAFGLGEMVGCLFIGYIIDRYGNKLTSIISLSFILAQTFITVLFLISNTYGPLVFLMTFTWGLADSVVNTHMQEISGFEFEDNIRPY